MNLTLHIVRNDLVRMRLWIALWAGLLLVPIAMGAALIGDERVLDLGWSRVRDTLAIITGVQVFMAYLLTILVLQEDSVVGAQAFWLTRPISRGRLLRAKTISVIAIVGLVPVAVLLPWWLWCGFDAGQIAAAAGETLAVLVLVALPGGVVAVLTDSFPRALLWSVASVAVLLFGGFYFLVGLAATTSGDEAERILIVVRCLVAIAGVALAMAALIGVQFLVRRRGRWTVAAVGLMVLNGAGAIHWPWAWQAKPAHEYHAERGQGIAIEFDGAVVSDPQGKRVHYRLGVPVERVETRGILRGAPRDLVLDGVIARQRWTWRDGTHLERWETFHADTMHDSLLGVRLERAEDRWSVMTKSVVGRELAPDEGYFVAPAGLPPSLVARMRKEPPRFEARLWFRVLRPELRVEIPLAEHPWTARRGHGIGITGITPVRQETDEKLTLKMVFTRPVFLSALIRDLVVRVFDQQPRWALLDRERGRLRWAFGELRGGKERVVVNGVGIEWRTLSVRAPGREGGGTSLVVFTMRELAVFSREVKVDGFAPAN